MAFHTPNPELRAIEEQNARLRARFFRALCQGLFRRAARGLIGVRRAVARAARRHHGCERKSCIET